jgi:hypothetical protein
MKVRAAFVTQPLSTRGVATHVDAQFVTDFRLGGYWEKDQIRRSEHYSENTRSSPSRLFSCNCHGGALPSRAGVRHIEEAHPM